MTIHSERPWRHAAKSVLIAAAALFVGGIMIHWSWNVFAVELLQAPEMRFKHALGLEILVAAVAAVAGASARAFGRGRIAA